MVGSNVAHAASHEGKIAVGIDALQPGRHVLAVKIDLDADF